MPKDYKNDTAIEAEPDCIEGYAHAWTHRGTGGCDSNPGVWSLGGTAFKYVARCVLCGCERTTIEHGWQRNPYECDEVRYETHEHDVDADEARDERRRQDKNRRARARYRARRATTAYA